MIETEAFAKPQSRSTHSASSSRHDEDDEGHVFSINAMTIQVDNDDHHSVDTFSRPSKDTAGGKITTSSANVSTTSLRNMLGVPPISNGVQRTLHTTNSSNGSTLGVPPSTSARTAPAGIGGASGAVVGGSSSSTAKSIDGDVETFPSEIAPTRRKVALGPGCSAMDWARIKSAIPSKGFRKIKPSELKLHNAKDDAWSVFNGKVYDMTPYMRFHPGGEKELLRAAGRDGTRLFSESGAD
jgi:hypothetical protein